MIVNDTYKQQGIFIFDDVYTAEFCDHMVDQFDLQRKAGCTWTRQDQNDGARHEKTDKAFIPSNADFDHFKGIDALNMYWEKMQECFEVYREYFSLLKMDTISAKILKLQQIDPGEGYHLYHSEYAPFLRWHNRCATFITYFNTLEPESGGETEFLIQKLRVRPKQGTTVIWPAFYTHPHRGNLVLGEKSKYIATGWFHYEG